MTEENVSYEYQEGLRIATYADGIQVTQPSPNIMSAPEVTADTATTGELHTNNPINQQPRSESSQPTYGSTDIQTSPQPSTTPSMTRPVSAINVFEPNSPAFPAVPNSAAWASETRNPNESTNKNETSHQDFMSYALENVEYEKSRLQEGDTLVFIDYPGDVPYYEAYPTGPVSFPQRVHSKHLLATGSEVFKALLQKDKHHRTCRRRKLVGRLPDGIDWVIDLTPPDEGDEAVNLTADLSCSFGVRSWASAQRRCHISGALVSGKDELTRIGSQAPTLKRPSFNSYNHDTNNSLNPNASTSEDLHQVQSVASGEFESPRAATTEDETDLQAGIRASQGEALASAFKSTSFKATRDENSNPSATNADSNQLTSLVADQVPEYSPVRHRAGIERVLRVIEGRDPGLDSAVKVWTLFTLAKYFDCTQTVVDYIITWLLADPNSLFIEILPEATAKIGMGLKNDSIYRSALSILISEEALALKSRELGKLEADKNCTNQFGRLREDLDDDMRQVIEYASKSFADRIGKKFADFLEVKTSWLVRSNFGKIIEFEHDLKINCPDSDLYKRVHKIVEDLTQQLRNYVRSNIVYVLSNGLEDDETASSEAHRMKERYKANISWRHSQDIYNDLENSERIMTTFFWKKLKFHKLSDLLHGAYYDDKQKYNENKNANNIHPIRMESILQLKLLLNEAMIEAISAGKFNNGKIPEECFFTYTPAVKKRDTANLNHNNNVADDWGWSSAVQKTEDNFDRKFKEHMFKPDVKERTKAKSASGNSLEEQIKTYLRPEDAWSLPSERPDAYQGASDVDTGEPSKSCEKRRKLVVVNADPILNDPRPTSLPVRQRIDRVLGQSRLQVGVSTFPTKNQDQDLWPLKHKQAGGSPPRDTGILMDFDFEDSPIHPFDSVAATRTNLGNGNGFADKNDNTVAIPSNPPSNVFDKLIQTTTGWLRDQKDINDDNSSPAETSQWGSTFKKFSPIWKDKGKGKAVIQDDFASSSTALIHDWDAGFPSNLDKLLDEALSSTSECRSESEASRLPENFKARRDSTDMFMEDTDKTADEISRTWNEPSRARSEVGNAKLAHIRINHEKALKKSVAAQKATATDPVSRPEASGTALEGYNVRGYDVKVSSTPQVLPDEWTPATSPFFSFNSFKNDVQDLIFALCDEMLDTSNICFDVGVTDTLLCLNDDENRYLPLWAGGYDDGTGGVFDADVPIADAGPVGPGPGYHTGQTNPSRPGSEWGTMSSVTMSGHTSAMADNGYSDYLANGKVYSQASSQDEWAFADALNKRGTMGAGDAPSESEIGTIPAQSVLSFDGLSDLGIQSSAASEHSTEYEMAMDDDDEHDEDNDDNAEDDDNSSEGTIGAEDFEEWGSEEDWGMGNM